MWKGKITNPAAFCPWFCHVPYLQKQAGNAPGWRNAQSSNRVKCQKYAKEHYFKSFIKFTAPKNPKEYP